jgi:hypothetical protein
VTHSCLFLAPSTKLDSPELTRMSLSPRSVWRDAWRRDGETNSLPGNKEVFTSKTFRTGTEIDFFIIPSNSGKVKMTWRFNLHWTIVICIFKIHTTKYYFIYRNVKIEGMYKGMPIIWPIMTSKSVKRGVSEWWVYLKEFKFNAVNYRNCSKAVRKCEKKTFIARNRLG